jgi:TATA-box binding protein (TBP) (component of TFIID and TFIIIB)
LHTIFYLVIESYADKDPDVQPIFRMCVENIIATSDLRILKRLEAVETVLELNDYQIEDEEAENTIPRQISVLSDQMEQRLLYLSVLKS